MIADLTWFFHWAPSDAEQMPWSRVEWWVAQANRIAARMTNPMKG